MRRRARPWVTSTDRLTRLRAAKHIGAQRFWPVWQIQLADSRQAAGLGGIPFQRALVERMARCGLPGARRAARS